MADPTRTRRIGLALVVLGILATLAAMVLVAELEGGDQTDQLNPQNGQVITVLTR